jgi:ABC-type multidrug transport system fused ATPase/permease subunit
MITFRYLLDEVRFYKKKIFLANIIAIFTIIISVPIPLFIPMLVDELILGKEGKFMATVNQFIDISSPEYYILIVFILTIIIRVINVWLTIICRVLVDGVIEDIRLNMRKKGLLLF